MKTLIKILLVLFPFFGFAQLGTGLYGKVGVNVGTTAPSERLKVNGTSNFTGLATLSGGIAATGTVSLPSTTSIGSVSATELGYINGVTENIQTQFSNKVDKIAGKGLSENDYTTAEKNKLSEIVSGQVFKGSWNASTNSPTLTTTPSANGDYYIVSVAGTQSITGSSTAFVVGDRVISNGTAWFKTSSTTVIGDKTIIPKMTSFLRQGKNLFDKNTATLSYFLGNNNVAVSNTTYAYSDYIPVLPSTTYFGTGGTGMRFTTHYDIGKSYIAGGSSSTITSFTTPSNVYYVRVTFEKADINKFQFEQSSQATLYEKFVYKLDSTYVVPDPISTNSYADSSVTEIKLKNSYAKVYKTKNLFDKTSATLNKFLGNDNTVGTSTDFAYSDYIPVLPSTTYYGRGATTNMRFTTYFGINKNYISGGSNGEIATFTTPSNVYFVRVTFYKAEIESFQFEQSSTQTTYTKPFVIADNVQVNTSGTSAHKGKIWSQIGDSITQQAQWQSTVSNRLELGIGYNYGRAGTKVTGLDTNAIASQRRIDQIKSTSEIVVFMGGTNDWANDVALGTIADTSSLVFYGAVKNLVKRLTVKFPNKMIVGLSTPWGKMPSRVGWTDTYGLKNNLGLTTLDYAKVVEDVCKSMGVLYVDIYGKSGINDYNYTTYFTNDGAFLHPNSVGGIRFGNVISSELFSFFY